MATRRGLLADDAVRNKKKIHAAHVINGMADLPHAKLTKESLDAAASHVQKESRGHGGVYTAAWSLEPSFPSSSSMER